LSEKQNTQTGERREASAGLIQYSPENLVPFGPVHPALKEPEYFKLILEGEKIVDVIPRIGYVHRGIERAAQERTWIKNIYLFERICGICSFAHSLSYVQAVEGILQFEVPRRARYIRVLVAELERIHSHMLWLGLVGYWTGFDTLFMWIWKDREHVLDLVEAITGNRIHKSYSTISGVRRDLPENIAEPIKKEMAYIQDRARYYKELVSSEETLISRTKGVGRIDADVAKKLCPVGPLLRCTGIARDIRVEDPYAAYDELIPQIKTSTDGDIASLLSIRVDEVLESCRLVLEAIEKIPSGPIKLTAPRSVPKGESMFHVEAPRGELFYYVKSPGGTIPERVKIRTPTMANILTATSMLKGHTLADVPVVLTGMDPCFGCMDRISILEIDKEKEWSVKGEELRQYGINYYGGKRSSV
jgi:Ni,Fe-hydrogenase III large subunit